MDERQLHEDSEYIETVLRGINKNQNLESYNHQTTTITEADKETPSEPSTSSFTDTYLKRKKVSSDFGVQVGTSAEETSSNGTSLR